MKTKLKSIKKEYYWIISFVLASFAILIFSLVEGMIGGDYIVLRSDLLSGSITGIKCIARSILNGENPWFSFDVALGLNVSLPIAFVAMSPFNLLYVIFYNADENIITLILIALKLGLASASFQFFSRKILKNDGFFSIIISLFYSLCSYSFIYGTIHIMWLDAIYILPFLCVVLLRCLKENKRVLLILTYAYLFITQFYVAYMVGMFSLLVVILYLLVLHETENNKSKMKDISEKFLNWFISGVIAVMLSAVIWAPALFFLMANKVEDATSIIEIKSSLLQIINGMFWGVGYGVEGSYGYIYSGIPVFLLVIMFFVNKKIGKKIKTVAGILVSFLLMCIAFTPLNSFMHAFDQPDNFWFRFTFILVFCFCAIAAVQAKYLEDLPKKTIILIVTGMVLLYQLQIQLEATYNIDVALLPTLNNNNKFVINMLLVILWLGIFILFFRISKAKVLVSLFAVILTLAETISNAHIIIPQKELAEDFYQEYNSIKNASAELKRNDDGLYRVLYTNGLLSNTGTWFGYQGITYFSDSEKYNVRKVLSNLGFSTSTRWVDQCGYTPVTEMLLGLKYNIKYPNPIMDFGEEKDEEIICNEHALSYGYMVAGDTILYEFPGRNVFENMNTLVNTLSGLDANCYIPVPEEEVTYTKYGCSIIDYSDGETKSLTLDDVASRFYITFPQNGYENAYIQMEMEPEQVGYYPRDFYVYGNDNRGSTKYVNACFSNANHMYYDSFKEEFQLYYYGEAGATPDSIDFTKINSYYFDSDAFQKQYEVLSGQQLLVEEWKDGYVKGSVNIVDDKRIMLLTIPYDPGWIAEIDGKDTEIVRLIDGAFMGLIFPSDGEHTVELKYECPGLKIGLIVSLLGIIALLAVGFEKQIKSFNKKAKKNEE